VRGRFPKFGDASIMTEAELIDALPRYKWYHIIPLTSSVSTPGNRDFATHNPPVLRQMDAVDFRCKRVLDVGCRDGLFSLPITLATA
jgi:hypothetical protein